MRHIFDTGHRGRSLLALAVAGLVTLGFAVSGSPAQADLKIPSLVYRTGAYAPNGIPVANGFLDYFAMLNERDGGIEGQRANVVECETAYNTKRGVECYEKLKENMLLIHPYSTGITYQLIPKATADKIPVHSMGYGRTSAANGRVFPYIFNFPGTYWDAASIIINHLGDVEKGMGNLKGKKVTLVFHNSAYGKEPIPTLEKLSEKHGFEFATLPVNHPGQEQKSTWLQIRRTKPDYVILWGWGVMNQVAVKEAISIGFPRERMVGVWWSSSEYDMLAVGEKSNGYKAINFHGVGSDYPLFDDIRKHVYDKGNGSGERDRIGEVLYNRGVIGGLWAAEAIRNAMRIHSTKNVTGEMVRDGYEALDVTEQRMADLGLPGFVSRIKVSCANHGGPGRGFIQQWDAKKKTFVQISEFGGSDRSVVDPLIAADSEAYAKENNITPRDC